MYYSMLMQKTSNVYKTYLLILYFSSLVFRLSKYEIYGGKQHLSISFKPQEKVSSTLKFFKRSLKI